MGKLFTFNCIADFYTLFYVQLTIVPCRYQTLKTLEFLTKSQFSPVKAELNSTIVDKL